MIGVDNTREMGTKIHNIGLFEPSRVVHLFAGFFPTECFSVRASRACFGD